MKLYFTQQQKENDLNKLEIEDVLFSADYIEGVRNDFRIVGSAVIEGETYPDFEISFTTIHPVTCENPAEILGYEWDSYAFEF